MNGKITAWLFSALLTLLLIMMGYIGNVVSSLDVKVDALAITQARNNTLLEILEKKILR